MRIRTPSLLMVVAALFAGGCASRPTVSFRTVADFEHAFAPVASAPVRVVVWRADDDAAGEGEARAGRVVPPAELTLEERNFLAGVQEGLRRAGFDVTTSREATEGLAYVMLATMDTVTSVYDTFRRVPVMHSTTGYVYGRGGFRSYTETTTSDYVVPERRPFVHRIVTLTAIPGEAAADDGARISPESPAAVWRGRAISDAEVIDEALPAHIATMLETWGVTATRDVKYERAE